MGSFQSSSLLIYLVIHPFDVVARPMSTISSAHPRQTKDSANQVSPPTRRADDRAFGYAGALTRDTESWQFAQVPALELGYDSAKDMSAFFATAVESMGLSEVQQFIGEEIASQIPRDINADPLSLGTTRDTSLSFSAGIAAEFAPMLLPAIRRMEGKHNSSIPPCSNEKGRATSASDQTEDLSSKSCMQKRLPQGRNLSSILLSNKSKIKTNKRVKSVPLVQVNNWRISSKDEATRRKEFAENLREVEANILANPRKPINAALEAGAKILQRNIQNYCVSQNITCTPTTELPTALFHALVEDSRAGEFLAAVEDKLNDVERAFMSSASNTKDKSSGKTTATTSNGTVEKGTQKAAKARSSPSSAQEDNGTPEDSILPLISSVMSPLMQLMRSSDQLIGDSLGDVLSGLSVPPGVRTSFWVLAQREEECFMTIKRTPTEMLKCKSFVMQIPLPPAIVLEPPVFSLDDPLSLSKLFVWGFELSCLSQLGCSSSTDILQPDVFDGIYEFSYSADQDTVVYVKSLDETPVTFHTGDKVHKLFLLISNTSLRLGPAKVEMEEEAGGISAAILPDSSDLEHISEKSTPYAYTDTSPFLESDRKDQRGSAAGSEDPFLFGLLRTPTRWHVTFPGDESRPAREFLAILKVRPWA